MTNNKFLGGFLYGILCTLTGLYISNCLVAELQGQCPPCLDPNSCAAMIVLGVDPNIIICPPEPNEPAKQLSNVDLEQFKCFVKNIWLKHKTRTITTTKDFEPGLMLDSLVTPRIQTDPNKIYRTQSKSWRQMGVSSLYWDRLYLVDQTHGKERLSNWIDFNYRFVLHPQYKYRCGDETKLDLLVESTLFRLKQLNITSQEFIERFNETP